MPLATRSGLFVDYKNSTAATRFIQLLLLCSLSCAFSASWATTVISTDNFSQKVYSPQYFIDNTHKLTYEQLRAHETPNMFARWHNPQIILPSNSAVWLKVTVRNATGQDTSAQLRVTYTDTEQIQAFTGNDNKNAAINLFQNQKMVQVTVKKRQSSDVYFRIHSRHPARLNIYLEDTKQALKNAHMHTWVDGTLYGFNLFLLVLTIVFCFLRQSSLPLHIAGIAIICLFMTLAKSGSPEWLWEQSPVAPGNFIQMMICLGYALYSSMSHKLLATHESPAARRLLQLIFGINIVGAMLSLALQEALPFWLINVIVIFNSLALITTGLIRLYDDFQPGSWWLALVIPHSTIQITEIMATLSVLPFDTVVLEYISNVATILVLLPALFLKQEPKKGREYKHHESGTHTALHPELEWNQLGHELRTPLNGILGMTELIQNTNLSARQRDYIHTIQLSGQELLTLINQTMDITKINQGKLQPLQDYLDPEELVHDCVKRYSFKAEQMGLELVSWVDAHVPKTLIGDHSRIARLLNTLMSHAINHMEQGEIALSASLASMPPTSLDKPGITHLRLNIKATDNGAGFGEARTAFGLDSAINPHALDAGSTALRQIYTILRHLGGTAGVYRTEGDTHYWITLPLMINPTGQSQHSNPTAELAPNHRALVVDDNDTCRRVLVQQLQRLGIDISQARDASEAMAILRMEASMNRPFTFILLDHQMIGISGLQLAERIAMEPLLDDLIIIMLTGLEQLPQESLDKLPHIKRVLTKPVSGKELEEVLLQELAKEQAFA